MTFRGRGPKVPSAGSGRDLRGFGGQVEGGGADCLLQCFARTPPPCNEDPDGGRLALILNMQPEFSSHRKLNDSSCAGQTDTGLRRDVCLLNVCPSPHFLHSKSPE